MMSVFMLTLANIKKRLVQSLLISLTIIMSSILLTTALGTLSSTKEPYRHMTENQNASHLSMQIENQAHDTEYIVKWWENKEEVVGVIKTYYFTVSGELNHNGEYKSMGEILLTEHPNYSLKQDNLLIVEGQIKDFPSIDELWVPTGFANSWNINVGDRIKMPIKGQIKEFSVSAIIVDPQFSAPIMSPVRMWTGNGFMDELVSEPQQLDVMIGVRFNDSSMLDKLWIEFEEYLQRPFMGFKVEYTTIGFAYSIIQSVLALVILLFSLIIILVSVFVIAFTISNAVTNDYTVIGILKAQGFSLGQIRSIYTFQYFVLSLITIPVGILLSKPIIKALMSQMIKSLGIASLNPSVFFPGLITFSVVVALVILSSYISSSKAGTVKPAEAIRNISPTKSNKAKGINIGLFNRLPISILLGLKSIFTGKKQSIFIIISALVLTTVLVFSVNIFNSINNMDKNFAFWGFDDADVLITNTGGNSKFTHKELLYFLNEEERVKIALSQNAIINVAIPSHQGISSQNLLGFAYDGDMNAIGALNLEGRNPIHYNEVAISYLVAQKYNKKTGDAIDIFIEGEKETYLITGIFQSVNFMGWSVRIQESAIKRINPHFKPTNYSIKLKSGYDENVFVEEMRDFLGDDYNIRTMADSGYINVSNITENAAILTLLLSIIFIIVAMVIIFNATLMDIYNNKKNYGIYKTLGMSPLQIRFSLLWKVSILASIGTLLGIPLTLFASPKLLGMLTGANLGIVKFPFDITILGTVAVIPISIIVLNISAWVPSGRILKFSPRNLIIE